MRILFSTLLFVSFAIRPVMQVTTVLYYQLNIDAIVEKYCINKERPSLNCNGKCYLMSQMKTKTESSSKTSNSIIITEAFIPLFFQENNINIENKNPLVIKFTKNWKLKHFQLQTLSKDIDPPPKFKNS
ncbi:hypothetical protein [Aquimarina muelleri]|uniref:Uncharacterized protein n=1 Tax=Aquimarina muelleri TaxID=279356 RepID=A0A918K0P7_9FLAO|nr:hypothetical protein [Aquimarina muelleri]MCX2764146.1 hypothetical protein [Aquimarina muelleri]GGX31461.1 hypothetical protein GCM10007384_35590 [Aquimarina muelleri]